MRDLRLIAASAAVAGTIAGLELIRLRLSELSIRFMLDIVVGVLLALTVGTWFFGWSWWQRVDHRTRTRTASSVLLFGLICAVQEETTVALLKLVLIMPAAIVLWLAAQDVTQSLKREK